MKRVTVFFENGSRTENKVDDLMEIDLKNPKRDGDKTHLVLFRRGVAVSTFNLQKIAGYTVEELI